MATDNKNRRLQELSGSDWEIVDGEPDIRGWDVKDASGQRIGEVDDLIFDTESRKVRYMVIDLEDNDLDLDDRDVLVPIGLAQLREDGDDVILTNVTIDQLRSLPEYEDEDALDSDFESGIRRVFGGVGDAALTGAAATGAALTSDSDTTSDRNTDFYNHEHFNEENLYRNRRQNAGSTATDEAGLLGSSDLETGQRETERSGIRLRSRLGDDTARVEGTNWQTDDLTTDRRATGVDIDDDAETRVAGSNYGDETSGRDKTARNTDSDLDNLNENNRRNKDSDLF